MSETDWRPSLPEAIAVAVVVAAGFVEAAVLYAITDGRLDGFVQTLVVAFAVATSRRAPAAGLALVWGLGLLHVRFGAPIMLVEFALTAVFFGSARWGRSATVVMSALSVPLAVVVAFVLHQGRTIFLHLLVGGSRIDDVVSQRPTLELALSLVAMLLVAAPWPAGLVMRSLDGARASRASMLAAEEEATLARRETDHVREVVQLRDQQTRLARDVHDVVGHSLAVILAQAESGQYLDDTEKLKKTLRTIATSARSSLQDVRQVLSSTRDPATVPEFDGLIAGARDSGHEIVATEAGTPRELSGETAAVAYRVFQEMLTNAIKHGRRDRPIVTDRHWTTTPADALLIEVTNGTDGGGTTGDGSGLDGMRRRLEEVGGHLDVQAAGSTFTVTAVVPVRDAAR
jgi:signal transduction histidine kinase